MQISLLTFFSVCVFASSLFAGDGVPPKSETPLSPAKSRFNLTCQLSFLNEALSLIGQPDEDHSIPVQMALNNLESGRFSEEEAAFEIANEDLKVLMKNRFFATIVAIHLQSDGFQSPDALENAVSDFRNRTEDDKLDFVDRVALSLIETIGPTLYSTNPESEKVFRRLSREFNLSSFGETRFKETWKKVVEHDYRDLRAYIWFVLENSHEGLAAKVRGANTLKLRILRWIGQSFKPVLIPRDALPSRAQGKSSEGSSLRANKTLLKALSVESISFIVMNEIESYSLDDLWDVEQILIQKDPQHRCLEHVKKRVNLLNRLDMRRKKLTEALNIRVALIRNQIDEEYRALAGILDKASAILSRDTTPTLSKLSEAESNVARRMDEISKSLQKELAQLSPTFFPTESDALTQLVHFEKTRNDVQEFKEKAQALMNNHNHLKEEEKALSLLVGSYLSRVGKVDMNSLLVTELEEDIKGIRQLASDQEKKSRAQTLLAEIVSSNLGHQVKKMYILRICLRIGDDDAEGIRDNQVLLSAFDIVRHATILSELDNDEIKEIWTRITNKIDSRGIAHREGDQSDLVTLLSEPSNWLGTKEFELKLIEMMKARISKLKSEEIDKSTEALHEIVDSLIRSPI